MRPLIPVFGSYILSFIYVAIYWNNHHHMFQTVKHVNGKILWANSHLLFWLSLVPFTTTWMGEHQFSRWPMIAYGFVLMCCGIAYHILAQILIFSHGKDSTLEAAVGTDVKGKISIAIYAGAIGLAFVQPYISFACYIGVALWWLIPDTRIERNLK